MQPNLLNDKVIINTKHNPKVDYQLKGEEDNELQFKDLYLCLYEFLKRFQLVIQNTQKSDAVQISKRIATIVLD